MLEFEGRFEDALDNLEMLSKNPEQVAAAVSAARTLGRAVDALQIEFEPDDEDASDLYYALIRKYYLESIEDIEGFIDDGDAVG